MVLLKKNFEQLPYDISLNVWARPPAAIDLTLKIICFIKLLSMKKSPKGPKMTFPCFPLICVMFIITQLEVTCSVVR